MCSQVRKRRLSLWPLAFVTIILLCNVVSVTGYIFYLKINRRHPNMALKRHGYSDNPQYRHVHRKLCRKSYPSALHTQSLSSSSPSQPHSLNHPATMSAVSSTKLSSTLFTSPSSISSSSNCNALATPIPVPKFQFAGKDCFSLADEDAVGAAIDLKFFQVESLTELLHRCADFCLAHGDSCGQYFVNSLTNGCFLYLL
jgi:hypothetical protein